MNIESPTPTPKDWDDKSMDIIVMDPMVIRGLTNEDGHLSFWSWDVSLKSLASIYKQLLTIWGICMWCVLMINEFFCLITNFISTFSYEVYLSGYIMGHKSMDGVEMTLGIKRVLLLRFCDGFHNQHNEPWCLLNNQIRFCLKAIWKEVNLLSQSMKFEK